MSQSKYIFIVSMNVQKEYEELLETNVGQIIEENLANGIKPFNKAASCLIRVVTHVINTF